MSYGSGRDATYQLTRLANTLDEMNRKLTQALHDLERINRRLDAEPSQTGAQREVQTAAADTARPREKAAS